MLQNNEDQFDQAKKYNNGVTGLKKSGHKTNSIDRAQFRASRHFKISKWLIPSFFVGQNTAGTQFEEDSIETNSEKLSDRFLVAKFDQSALKVYFDNDAWTVVCALVALKIKSCTCVNCNKVCLENCIACDMCNKWFHSKCQKVSDCFASGKGKEGLKCSFCLEKR